MIGEWLFVVAFSLVSAWTSFKVYKVPAESRHVLVGAHGNVWCARCRQDTDLLGKCPAVEKA